MEVCLGRGGGGDMLKLLDLNKLCIHLYTCRLVSIMELNVFFIDIIEPHL